MLPPDRPGVLIVCRDRHDAGCPGRYVLLALDPPKITAATGLLATESRRTCVDTPAPEHHRGDDRLLEPSEATVHASASTLIAINPVKADRADAFEAWLRTVVVPAVQQHRPEQVGRWSVLRADGAEDGVVAFAFLFDGGSAQEWELPALLGEALGPAGADDALREMSDMLERDQYGWSFAPVRLDAP